MKRITLAEAKEHLLEYLLDAEKQSIVITHNGEPIGALVGFKGDDDWFDFRLENDDLFLKRVAWARMTLRRGEGIPWQDVQTGRERRFELE